MDKNDLKNIEDAQKKLGVEFKDPALLKVALTHRSYLNESKGITEHNERLEFLGDAVLELITTEYLFSTLPDRAEGELTSFRAALVRTESLAEVSTNLKIGENIFMSKGEEATGGRTRPYILANTFEALLGAMYKDQGYDLPKKFVLENLIPKIDKIIELRLDIDNKSKLQEISQEELKITPVYELAGENGPDHDKTFEMSVLIGEIVFGKGKGANKQEAAQNAAKEALENWEPLAKKYRESFD